MGDFWEAGDLKDGQTGGNERGQGLFVVCVGTGSGFCRFFF